MGNNMDRLKGRERAERLELIRQQVLDGTLTIRQATEAEIAQWQIERERRQPVTPVIYNR